MSNALRPSERQSLPKVIVTILCAYVLTGPVTVASADPPQRDPAGIATGDKTTTSDAGGNAFVVPEPTDKTAPDYAKNKQAFDEFQAQAAREPLAVKLADNVGHLRISTNFSWTLVTGYLVLFMQAGFALLTCGLVRKKNAGHLMMLNFAAYVFAFLAYYVCGYAFQYGGAAINAAPTNLGGTPTLDSLDRPRPVGLSGWQGLFSERSRLRCRQSLFDAL
jgi:Amt family ammonium transporter